MRAETVFTSGPAPARQYRLCHCHRCGKVERATPAHDFYTLADEELGPLYCEACFVLLRSLPPSVSLPREGRAGRAQKGPAVSLLSQLFPFSSEDVSLEAFTQAFTLTAGHPPTEKLTKAALDLALAPRAVWMRQLGAAAAGRRLARFLLVGLPDQDPRALAASLGRALATYHEHRATVEELTRVAFAAAADHLEAAAQKRDRRAA